MARKIEEFELAGSDGNYTIPEEGQDFYLGEGDAIGWIIVIDREKAQTVEMFNLRHVVHIRFTGDSQ